MTVDGAKAHKFLRVCFKAAIQPIGPARVWQLCARRFENRLLSGITPPDLKSCSGPLRQGLGASLFKPP